MNEKYRWYHIIGPPWCINTRRTPTTSRTAYCVCVCRYRRRPTNNWGLIRLYRETKNLNEVNQCGAVSSSGRSCRRENVHVHDK